MPLTDLDLAPADSDSLVDAARAAGEDVAAALDVAVAAGPRLPQPGSGHTIDRWAVLAALARVNLTVARVVEAHSDALAILAEAGMAASTGATYGVFAAEAPDQRLVASRDGAEVCLGGTKPWCSLGGSLTAALVTAHDGDQRGLFLVDLRHKGVHAHEPEGWVARGLRTIVSVPVDFDEVPATPVGAPHWYLTRDGFAWGGIGVAACWYGGAAALVDAVCRRAAKRTDDIANLQAGQADVALHGARTALTVAAAQIDAGTVKDPELLALRTRSVVADAVERVLVIAGHALGPAALAFDGTYAARVADLELYVRQHHAERDLAALGERVAGEL